ncbi:hypothetical protein BHT94_15395 [Bacillus licheniformis]|nr:hypothetical protein BHT94_15395 [Bacillus licheniformis]
MLMIGSIVTIDKLNKFLYITFNLKFNNSNYLFLGVVFLLFWFIPFFAELNTKNPNYGAFGRYKRIWIVFWGFG